MDAYKQYTRRLQSLTEERSPFFSHWQEISRYLLPRAGRYFVTDRNAASKYNTIYDSSATRAHRVLASGLMAGATSPARPWARLKTPDDELNQFAPVRVWLSRVMSIMFGVFARSNTYRALHSIYDELGAFGTSASLMLDDYDEVVCNYTLTAGEYAIAADYKGRVNTLYRRFNQTVINVVSEFGYKNCSPQVRNMYDTGNYDKTVTIIHAMEPRTDRDISKRDARNMPFKSVYFEDGRETSQLLRESGFKRFRALTPRWNARPGDDYGNGPGMEALGYIKSLQHEQLRKAEAIDYQTKPPLQVPTSMKNREMDRLPGGISYYDTASGNNAIKTLFDVRLDLNALLIDIQDVRGQIDEVFFKPLFLMLASQDTRTMTATEVAERHEEKLLMLGPVLEGLHKELLQPLISITFERMLEAGLVPPPPEELQGQELDVEFVSVLAQAQRAVNTTSMDRFVISLGQIAQMKPEVLDKFDQDRWADSYADMLGVDPEVIVASDQVAIVRNARAQQQQAAQQAAMVQQGAIAANKLANAPTNGQNALTDVMQQLTGY